MEGRLVVEDKIVYIIVEKDRDLSSLHNKEDKEMKKLLHFNIVGALTLKVLSFGNSVVFEEV